MHRRTFLPLLAAAALADCRRSTAVETDYRRVQSAIASGDDLQAIKAREDYLTALHGLDPNPARTAQVRLAYKRAFTRWVVGLPAEPGADARQRLERFVRLSGGSRGRGSGS